MELPIIAGFRIDELGLDFVDYRAAPAEDHQLAVGIAGEQAKRLAEDDQLQTFVPCEDDPRIEQFRHDAFIREEAAGRVQSFQDLDRLGLGQMDDYVPDPRYPDQSLLAYDDGQLVGSAMLLKMQWQGGQGGQPRKIRASTTPWIAIVDRPGMEMGELWGAVMNFLLDTSLPFDDDLPGNPGTLDIIEWFFPVSRPELDLFTHSDNPGHRMRNLRQLATTGRDVVIDPGTGIAKQIRRRGEVWPPVA
jgi:hypothetical protein